MGYVKTGLPNTIFVLQNFRDHTPLWGMLSLTEDMLLTPPVLKCLEHYPLCVCSKLSFPVFSSTYSVIQIITLAWFWYLYLNILF